MDRRTKGLTAEQQAAKEYLEAFRDLNAEVDERTEHLRELRERARSVGGYDLSSPRSGSHGDHADRVGRAAARIVDAENALADLLEKYCARYRETSRLLDQLDNVDDYVLLHARYFRVQKWEDVAVTLDVAPAYVFRIHKRALQALGELLTGAAAG